MDRRQFLAGTAAVAVAAPSIARGQGARVIKFVPEADVVIYDPVLSPSWQTRDHAFLVYDTLFGVDNNFKAHPQMVEGVNVENDGKQWKLTLRDGMKFHDGEKVLAKDAVASVKRWAQRDAFGQALMSATDDLSATDDRTMQFRLKRPFPLLPEALAKPNASMCPIMPERLASTDANKAVTDTTGSGPFKYVPGERVAGSRIVYERFADYVPRKDGPQQFTAGPKVTNLDRVEWQIINDQATAAAALERGEIDWLQTPLTDLIPRLRQNKDLVVKTITPNGLIAYLRFNHLHPPFNNPGVRRAILGAITQSDYMIALNGPDKTLWHDNVGYFCPDTPLASNAGMDKLMGKRDYAKVKKDLEAAGYKGEKVALMVAVNISYLKIMGEVTADVFKKIGLNVDYQAVDWSTVSQRRAKMEPPDQGGWSAFAIYDNGSSQVNPASHSWLRGNGKSASFGWPESPKIEELRSAWFAANDLDEQKKICTAIQLQAFEDVPYIPLGQSIPFTGFRKNITGVLEGQPVFWNIKKA